MAKQKVRVVQGKQPTGREILAQEVAARKAEKEGREPTELEVVRRTLALAEQEIRLLEAEKVELRRQITALDERCRFAELRADAWSLASEAWKEAAYVATAGVNIQKTEAILRAGEKENFARRSARLQAIEGGKADGVARDSVP